MGRQWSFADFYFAEANLIFNPNKALNNKKKALVSFIYCLGFAIDIYVLGLNQFYGLRNISSLDLPGLFIAVGTFRWLF